MHEPDLFLGAGLSKRKVLYKINTSEQLWGGTTSDCASKKSYCTQSGTIRSREKIKPHKHWLMPLFWRGIVAGSSLSVVITSCTIARRDGVNVSLPTRWSSQPQDNQPYQFVSNGGVS